MDDITKFMDQLQITQTEMKEIGEKWARIHATGEAGAGAVKATVDGHRRLLKLDIDTAFLRPEEKEALQDLIIAAITLATQAVDDKVKDDVKEGASEKWKDLPEGFIP
jgi:nucleoid-associated protein EbfC